MAGRIAHREKQLALVLNATLERLAPPARAALDFAALLAPDCVPWPWLKALLAQAPDGLRPAEAGHPDPWAEVRRQLEDMRLLTATEHPAIARLHRLVGAHLRSRMDPAEVDRKAGLIRQLLLEVAEVLQQEWHQNAARPWQWAPLQAAIMLVPWAAEDEGYGDVAGTVGKLEMDLGHLDLAGPLLQRGLDWAEQRCQASPEEPQAIRTLAWSLGHWADFLDKRGQEGDADRALQAYERCLKISEELLAAHPEWVDAVRSVSVSLNRLADFLQDRRRSASLYRLVELLRTRGQPGDAGRALEYLKRSLQLFEQVEQATYSAQAKRDVTVALTRFGDFLIRREESGMIEKAMRGRKASLEPEPIICLLRAWGGRLVLAHSPVR